jgi:hypothetical protein
MLLMMRRSPLPPGRQSPDCCRIPSLQCIGHAEQKHARLLDLLSDSYSEPTRLARSKQSRGHAVRLGNAQLHGVVPRGIELDIILCLGPQRLTALLCSVEREGEVHNTAERAATFVAGDVRERNQRRHLGRCGAAATGLSRERDNEQRKSDDRATDSKLHGRLLL